MLTGPTLILTLKVLVSAVTLLYILAIAAIVTGHRKLHGRLNTIFFILTLITVFGFELLLRFGVKASEGFGPETHRALRIHLLFAVPSALLLPVVFWLGRTHRRQAHMLLANLFTLLWFGTFITGVFTLPHTGR